MKTTYEQIVKEISTQNIFDLLSKYGMKNCYPYMKSLSEKRNYMLLSYELYLNTVETAGAKIKETGEKKARELYHDGWCTFGERDTKIWDVVIEGYTVNFKDMIRKSIWDFFHYAKLSLDMILQIINTTILEESLPEEEVRFEKLEPYLSEHKEIIDYLKCINKNSMYSYIQSFENYMKHINSVPVQVKLKSGGIMDFTNMALEGIYIQGFQHKDKSFKEVEATERTTEVRDYVIKTLKEFLVILFLDYIKNKERAR